MNRLSGSCGREIGEFSAQGFEDELLDYLMWALRPVEQDESVPRASSHLIAAVRRLSAM